MSKRCLSKILPALILCAPLSAFKIGPTALLGLHLDKEEQTIVNYLNAHAQNQQITQAFQQKGGTNLLNALDSWSPTKNFVKTLVIDDMMFRVSQLVSPAFSNMHEHRLYWQPAPAAEMALGVTEFDEDELLVSAKKERPPKDKNKDKDAEKKLPYGQLKKEAKDQETNDLWISTSGAWGHQTPCHNTSGYKFNSDGFMVGYDKFFPVGGSVGGAIGYYHSNSHSHHNWGKNFTNSLVMTSYGNLYLGDGYLDFSLNGSVNWNKSYSHTTIAPGTFLTPQGYFFFAPVAHFSGPLKFTSITRSTSYALVPHIGGGYDFKFGMFIIEPFASLDFAVNFEPPATGHGALGYDVHSKSTNSYMLRSEAGVRFYQKWYWDWGSLSVQETVAYINKAPFHTGYTTKVVGATGYYKYTRFNQTQNLVTGSFNSIVKGYNGWFGSLGYCIETSHGYATNSFNARVGKYF